MKNNQTHDASVGNTESHRWRSDEVLYQTHMLSYNNHVLPWSDHGLSSLQCHHRLLAWGPTSGEKEGCDIWCRCSSDHTYLFITSFVHEENKGPTSYYADFWSEQRELNWTTINFSTEIRIQCSRTSGLCSILTMKWKCRLSCVLEKSCNSLVSLQSVFIAYMSVLKGFHSNLVSVPVRVIEDNVRGQSKRDLGERFSTLPRPCDCT